MFIPAVAYHLYQWIAFFQPWNQIQNCTFLNLIHLFVSTVWHILIDVWIFINIGVGFLFILINSGLRTSKYLCPVYFTLKRVQYRYLEPPPPFPQVEVLFLRHDKHYILWIAWNSFPAQVFELVHEKRFEVCWYVKQPLQLWERLAVQGHSKSP